MDRILRNTPATISGTFTVDGAGVDPAPDSATVTVTRNNGTVLVASTAATNVTGQPGRFEFPLTTTHTALLDVLTARWVSTNLGTIETTVEVVGGFLFTLADARTITPLDNATAYPSASVLRMRTLVEQSLEDACGVAFVPRYARETLNGNGAYDLTLRPRVLSIRSAEVDDVALTAGELAELKPITSGVWSPDRWTAGFSNVEIVYEHGYRIPPPRVSQAALRLTKQWLVEGPTDDRSTSMSTDDGTFSLVTPGLRGAIFSSPEANQVVRQYAAHLGV